MGTPSPGVTGYRADGIGNARGCVVKGLDKRPLSVMLKVVSNDTIKTLLFSPNEASKICITGNSGSGEDEHGTSGCSDSARGS